MPQAPAQDWFAANAPVAVPPPATRTPVSVPVPSAPAAQTDWFAANAPAVSHTPQALQPPPGASAATTRSRTGQLYDPNASRISPETSRLLGGMLGSAALGLATEGMGLIPEAAVGAGALVRGGLTLARSLPSIAGAYGGGAGVAAAQGAPPSEIHEAGTEQAAYEVGGKLVAGAVKWPLKRLAATSLYKGASKAIASGKQAITDQIGGALTQAQQAVESATATKATADASAKVATAATTTAGQQSVTAAQEALATGKEAAQDTLSGAKSARTSQLDAARDRFAQTAPPSSTTGEAGRQLAGVLDKEPPTAGQPRSPVNRSFRQMGERLGNALKEMPDQDVTAIKREAQDILDRETVLPVARQESPGGLSFAPGSSAEARYQEAVGKANLPPPAAEVTPIASPSRTALLRIANMPDQVTADELHTANDTLNTVVGSKWDSGLSNKNIGRAKKLYGVIRTQLGAASPEFDQASAEYAKASKLYKNSLAPKMVKLAQSNPDAVAGLIKPDNPEQLKMLQQVLFEHGGPEGQQAWDTLRSHVIHDQFIAGGLDKLGERLATAPKAFVSTLAHDKAGQQVIGNLQQIAHGFDQLQETLASQVNRAAGDLRAVTRTGQRGVRAAQSTATANLATAQGAQRMTIQGTSARVTAAKQTEEATAHGLKQATGQVAEREKALEKSSLKGIPSGAQTAKDLATLGAVGLAGAAATHLSGVMGGGAVPSAFGGSSAMWIARHEAVVRLLKSPQLSDLVQWASYGPTSTQALIHALQSPAPGMMLADLMRSAGIALEEPMAVSHPKGGPPTPVASPPPK